MTHSKTGKSTKLYGQSVGFGAADVNVTVSLLKGALGQEHDCTFGPADATVMLTDVEA